MKRTEIITEGLNQAIKDIENYFNTRGINTLEQQLVLQQTLSRVNVKFQEAKANRVVHSIPGMESALKFLNKNQDPDTEK